MVYELDIRAIVKGEPGIIGTRLVAQVLRSLKSKDAQLSCTQKNLENLYIEEVHQYNDIFRSVTEDKRSHTYVIKTKSNKRIALCFEPRMDRVQVRTLQQKLSDVTTDYVLSQLKESAFLKVFESFYKPMDLILTNYAAVKRLELRKDIAIFYKGGNMFRVILGGLIQLFDNPEYEYLMKRSDADFQIFINPALPHVDTIRKEVSVLVLYVLDNMREYLRRSATLRISGSTSDLRDNYTKMLEQHDTMPSSLSIHLREAARKDFVVSKGKIADDDNNDYIVLQEMGSLLKGLPDANRSTYFISHNTSLDFARKDKLRATFDLIRMRRNFKLDIMSKDTGEAYSVNAPFEIIDVSIPKGDDYGLSKLRKLGAANLLREYTYTDKMRNITFLAPTVAYLLTDLHDLLFKQNEYPWNDIKYAKRMTRYFLTIIVYSIMDHLGTKDNDNNNYDTVFNTLRIIQRDFERFHTGVGYELEALKVLGAEIDALRGRIASLPEQAEREAELKNLDVFVAKVNEIFRDLANKLERLVAPENVQRLYADITNAKVRVF